MEKRTRIDAQIGMHSAINSALEIARAHLRLDRIDLARKWEAKAMDEKKKLDNFIKSQQ